MYEVTTRDFESTTKVIARPTHKQLIRGDKGRGQLIAAAHMPVVAEVCHDEICGLPN